MSEMYFVACEAGCGRLIGWEEYDNTEIAWIATGVICEDCHYNAEALGLELEI